MRPRSLLAVLIAAALVAAGAPAPAAPAGGPRDGAPPTAGAPLIGALQRAEAAEALPAPQGVAYREVLAEARATRDALHGVRRRELASVLRIAAGIARRGDLTVARMPAVFLTLQRNAQWWAANGP